MEYYSTSNKAIRVSLKQAVMQGLAADGGLYMPDIIKPFTGDYFLSLAKKSFAELSYDVAWQMLGEDLPSAQLEKIVAETIQFETPLIEVAENILALELFHGPTLAFKDFGARFLAGLMGFYASQQDKEIVVLVATSGDTGSAVANGFYQVPGTKVVVLYPSGKVSDIQEKQFTTLGGNITALEVEGTFDDCQKLVKQAFLDEDLKREKTITSANSINIARLIPQSFYYFNAYRQLPEKNREIFFAVPSGNFGNLTAGLLAKRLGLPISMFIAATNINDSVPSYLRSGSFAAHTSFQTISNAMDVGNPSNFARMLDLFQHDHPAMTAAMVGTRFTDEETKAAMRLVFERTGYVMDPHGAIGYLGIQQFLKSKERNSYTGIFLETAHPGKFKSVVEEVIGHEVVLPKRLKDFILGQKKSIEISGSYEELKSILRSL